MEGLYELHVTIAPTRKTCEWRDARSVAETFAMRWLHIVLDRGEHASQPMLTRSNVTTVEALQREARAVERALERVGFSVARVKIEGDLHCGELLEVADGTRSRRHGRYFEHHVKVLLRDEHELALAKTIADLHGAHASRNASAHTIDGAQRFLTLRAHDVSTARAIAAFDALCEHLERSMLSVRSRRSEYVVYDSRVELDHGWTTTSHRASP